RQASSRRRKGRAPGGHRPGQGASTIQPNRKVGAPGAGHEPEAVPDARTHQAKVKLCAVVPLQSHCWTFAPLRVELPLTSRHLPLFMETSVNELLPVPV